MVTTEGIIGYRIGLTKPNTFELSIIGIVTAYFKIIKLTSNRGRSDYINAKFRSHLICFQTNAPEVSYNLLSFQRLQKLIKLHFIVGENEIDELMERSRGSAHLQGRSFVVMQWLRILGKINKLYTSLQMKLPALHMIEAILNRTNNAFIDEAIVSVHQEDLHRKETIGDDVADSNSGFSHLLA